MTAKAPVYRVRHDLGRETVVLLSCLIFGGTFFYVFEDFLNVQIAALSPKLREWIAWAILGLLTLGLSGSMGWRLAVEKSHFRGLSSLALFWGEDPQIVKTYERLWTLILLALLVCVISLASHLWLVPIDLQRLCGLGVLIGATFFVSQQAAQRVVRNHGGQQKETSSNDPRAPRVTLVTGAFPSARETMVQYRIHQIFAPKSWRSWGIRLSQGLVAFCGAFSLVLTHSPFLSGMGSLLVGLILASFFAGFLAEDLSQSWTERGLGVTHSLYVATLEKLAWRLAWGPGVLLFIACFAVQTKPLFSGFPTNESLNLGVELFKNAVQSLQITALGVLPILTIPWTGLQIDGRKPGIPMMTSTILGLFLGSAVLAHPLALLLIPLLRSVALPYQEGRFYRAGL